MTRFLTRTIVTLSLCLIASVSHAELQGLSQYGVYVEGRNGYVAADSMPTRRHLGYDFTEKMFGFPVAQRGNQALELIVHYPDFHPGLLRVEARPMATAAARSPIAVSVEPLGNDQYRITAQKQVPDNRIVLVDLGCCVAGVHGIALSDPKAAIRKAYAKGADVNPVTAEQILGKTVAAVPGDSDLKRLHGYWRTRVAQEKATEHYAFIRKVWGRYESAEGSAARLKQLQHVKSLCQQYLENDANGRERDKVKALLAKVEDKLDV